MTLFHIEGGVGKNIAATSVIRSYKKQNMDRDIVVVTAYPDIFTNNINIKRTFQFGNHPYFYEDYILNKDIEIFAHDPYKTTDHITKKKHLIENWCNMLGVESDKELPDIHFNFRELELAARLIPQSDKPILVFQPFGGPLNQDIPYSWTRDIHPIFAQEIVQRLQDKYTILHICYPHHPHLQGVIRYDSIQNKKVLSAILSHSTKRLLIDSSLQHAAAAMRLPSTVVWVATQPEIFGYSIHKNVIPKTSHPKGTINSYIYDYSFNGVISECMYSNPSDIFNVEEIIKDL